jgi:hypothetical protein
VLKKLGLVSVGVTAGLMVAAPLASASESHHHADPHCNVESHAKGGNNYGVAKCNRAGEGNGVGNTLNGVELPAPPEFSAPDFPGLSDLGSGIPTSFAIPGI